MISFCIMAQSCSRQIVSYTVMFSKLYSSTCHLLDRMNWFCSAFIVSSDCQFLTLQFLNANTALFLSFLIASARPILMSTCIKCLKLSLMFNNFNFPYQFICYCLFVKTLSVTTIFKIYFRLTRKRQSIKSSFIPPLSLRTICHTHAYWCFETDIYRNR